MYHLNNMNTLNKYVERKGESKYSELTIPCSPQWASPQNAFLKVFEFLLYMIEHDISHQEMDFKAI